MADGTNSRPGAHGQTTGWAAAWLLVLLASVVLVGCARCGGAPSVAECEAGQTREREPGCGSCSCIEGRWVCSAEACVETEGSAPAGTVPPTEAASTPECTVDPDCRVSGCSNEVCAAETVVTACLFDPTFACYREPLTGCGCIAGQCAWRPSAELTACLASGGELAPPPMDEGPAGDGPPGPGGVVPGPAIEGIAAEGSELVVAP